VFQYASIRYYRGEVSVKRKRRTSEQIFLDKLATLTKGEPILLQNNLLREALGWDEQKYHDIRQQLRRDQRIIVGQGQGGKVGLAQQPNAKALKLFISYSHIDEVIKSEFIKHIHPLQRLKLIDSWHDGKISAGKELDDAITKEMNSADIVVMLISIDYLNSYYCIEIEMERAMERHAAGECRVIPIILRGCMWQHMPFSKLKALPDDAKAISTWDDRDEALVSVAEGIRIVADELLATR
jgi:TIR domain